MAPWRGEGGRVEGQGGGAGQVVTWGISGGGAAVRWLVCAWRVALRLRTASTRASRTCYASGSSLHSTVCGVAGGGGDTRGCEAPRWPHRGPLPMHIHVSMALTCTCCLPPPLILAYANAASAVHTPNRRGRYPPVPASVSACTAPQGGRGGGRLQPAAPPAVAQRRPSCYRWVVAQAACGCATPPNLCSTLLPARMNPSPPHCTALAGFFPAPGQS